MSFTTALQCVHKDSQECTCKTFHQGVSLMTAAEWGMEDLVRSKVNSLKGREMARRTDLAGYTALHLASQHGQLGVAKALVQGGADVNAMECGASPLHRACYAGHLEMAKFLVAYGGDPFAPDSSALGCGDLPVHKAARQKHSHVVEWMTREVAPELVNALNKEGKSCGSLLLQALQAQEPIKCLSSVCPSFSADGSTSSNSIASSSNIKSSSNICATATSVCCSNTNTGLAKQVGKQASSEEPVRFGLICPLCGSSALRAVRMLCCKQLACKSCFDESRQSMSPCCRLCKEHLS